eukprot:g64627.t1
MERHTDKDKSLRKAKNKNKKGEVFAPRCKEGEDADNRYAGISAPHDTLRCAALSRPTTTTPQVRRPA